MGDNPMAQQLMASAFMPQTRTPSAQGVGQATTPGYSQPMSLFAPMAQPPVPPPPLKPVPGAPPPVGGANAAAKSSGKTFFSRRGSDEYQGG